MADLGASTPAVSDGDRTRGTVWAVYADFLELLGAAFSVWLLTILVGGLFLGLFAVTLEWPGGAVLLLLSALQLVALGLAFSVLARRARAIRASLARVPAAPDAPVS